MDSLVLLSLVSSVLVGLYFPVAIWQFTGAIRGWSFPVRKRRRADPLGPIVSGRRVAVVICTNGENPDVVEWLLQELRGYRQSLDLFVIKEASDPFAYTAQTISVPEEYVCPNGSRKKMRALHFGTLRLREMGYGAETYLIFLDDDSLVTREYVRHVWRMTEDAGQGLIRLRSYGTHLLSSLADYIRVTDCETFCRPFNQAGRPLIAHGEGLVVRADLAAEIGWDYGTYGAEDLLMALKIRHRGHSFGLIPAYVLISPPTSRRDFFRQRRRWLFSFMRAHREIRDASSPSLFFGLYRYMLGWTGFIGLYLLIADYVLHAPLVPLIFGLSVFNLASYFVAYQYGASSVHSVRQSVLMFALQFAVAFYEGGTLCYSAFRPPALGSFEVIRKRVGIGNEGTPSHGAPSLTPSSPRVPPAMERPFVTVYAAAGGAPGRPALARGEEGILPTRPSAADGTDLPLLRPWRSPLQGAPAPAGLFVLGSTFRAAKEVDGSPNRRTGAFSAPSSGG